jgi:hypothetical protein
VKKLLAGGALAALTLGGIVVGAAPASAHTPAVSGICDAEAGSSITYNLTYYAAENNQFTLVVDGETVVDETFGNSLSGTLPDLDPTVEHTWEASVVASDGEQFNWGPGNEDARTPNGTENVPATGTIAACVEATPEPTPTPTPTPSEPPVTEPSEEPSVAPTDEASVPPAPVPSDEPSASPSPAAEEPPVLAATGATVGGAVAFAALLAAGGVALVWARKRMQNA